MEPAADPDGRPQITTGAGATRDAVQTKAKAAKAETSVELEQRRLDTVDLVVQGASLRSIAKRNGLGLAEVREDYLVGMDMLADRSMRMTLALRDEVTARQRLLIVSNMERARAGDAKSASIVQRADDMLVSIWGLRSIRVEMPGEPTVDDATLSEALTAYLAGVADQVRR